MFGMALKNVWQRKTRSALTVLGVGLAVVLFVYLSTIMDFYDEDLERTVSGFAGKVIVQAESDETERFPPTGSLIPADDADAVLGRAGVDPGRSSAVLLEPLVPNPAPSMPPEVMAVGVGPGHEFAFRGDATTAGAHVLGAADGVILGAKAAEHYGSRVGDTIETKGRSLKVVGVMREENELVDGAVLMPLATAQELLVRPDVVSAVMLTAREPDEVEALAKGIEVANPRLATSTPEQVARSADEVLETQRTFFATVRGTIVAVGVVIVAVVMLMAVSERRREIGTLKALGANRRQILSLILAEAVVLSLVGCVAAVLVAWLLTRNDDVSVDAALAAQTVVVAVLVGFLAALWPALSAQRVDPLESLRSE